MIIGDGPAARREATRRNRGATKAIASPPLALPLHPDEHRSEYPVLLAVDQELGECGALDAKRRDYPATPSDRTDDQLAVPPLRKTM